MNELLTFKRKLSALGLCRQYTDKWAECRDKASLVKLATDINGAQTMCDALAFGYGMPLDYIKANFADYINGGYVVDHGGYTSELFVGYNDTITVRSTLVILLGCRCKVVVPENRICRIFAAGSLVDIECHGECEVEYYTDKRAPEDDNYGISGIFGSSIDKVNVKLHNSSEWVK